MFPSGPHWSTAISVGNSQLNKGSIWNHQNGLAFRSGTGISINNSPVYCHFPTDSRPIKGGSLKQRTQRILGEGGWFSSKRELHHEKPVFRSRRRHQNMDNGISLRIHVYLVRSICDSWSISGPWSLNNSHSKVRGLPCFLALCKVVYGRVSWLKYLLFGFQGSYERFVVDLAFKVKQFHWFECLKCGFKVRKVLYLRCEFIIQSKLKTYTENEETFRLKIIVSTLH